jgi:hypothetical protein
MIPGACQISSSDILWVFGILIGLDYCFQCFVLWACCHTLELFTMAFWWDYGRLLGYSGSLFGGQLGYNSLPCGETLSRLLSAAFVLFTVVTLLALGAVACSCVFFPSLCHCLDAWGCVDLHGVFFKGEFGYLISRNRLCI